MGEKEEKCPDGVKYYRLSEIEEQNTFKSTWIIINNKVYDVTKFLEEVRNCVKFQDVLCQQKLAAASMWKSPTTGYKPNWVDTLPLTDTFNQADVLLLIENNFISYYIYAWFAAKVCVAKFDFI